MLGPSGINRTVVGEGWEGVVATYEPDIAMTCELEICLFWITGTDCRAEEEKWIRGQLVGE